MFGEGGSDLSTIAVASKIPMAESKASEILRIHFPDYMSASVDPVIVARSLGINVFSSPMPNSESGLITNRTANDEVVIFVNSGHARVRQRFTVAHEIGHYIKHSLEHSPDEKFYYKRNDLSSCGSDRDEIYANSFAAELLMPKERVRRLFSEVKDPIILASKFKVSLEAMRHRLVNLDLARD